MEAINGVTFEDWGAACGNLAQGMPEDEVCEVLGIELPVWQKTNEAWSGKLGDLMAEDMAIASTYSNFFTNPKVGKFANVQSDVPSLDALITIAPDYDAYQKIFWHQSLASEHGMDPTSVLEQYGLNLQNWSQLGMHYSKWHCEYLQPQATDYNERFQEVSAVMNKWQEHWKAHYKNDAVDLGDDIDF